MRHGTHEHPVMPQGSRSRRKFRAKRKPQYVPPNTEQHLWLRPRSNRG